MMPEQSVIREKASVSGRIVTSCPNLVVPHFVFLIILFFSRSNVSSVRSTMPIVDDTTIRTTPDKWLVSSRVSTGKNNELRSDGKNFVNTRPFYSHALRSFVHRQPIGGEHVCGLVRRARARAPVLISRGPVVVGPGAFSSSDLREMIDVRPMVVTSRPDDHYFTRDEPLQSAVTI